MKRIKRILGGCVLFAMLYFPPLLSFNMLFLVAFISAFYLIKEQVFKNSIIICREHVKVFSIFIFLIIEQIIVALVNGYGIAAACSDLVLIVVGFLFSSIVLSLYFTNNSIPNDDILDILLWVGFTQGMLDIYAFFNKDFQLWFIQKMIDYGYSGTRFSQLAAFRWYGVATQLGFATPIVQTVFVLISVYLGIVRKPKYFLFAPVLMFSAIINARTSAIVFVVGVCYVILFMTKRITSKHIWRLFAFLIGTLTIAIIGLGIMRAISPNTYIWVVYGLLAFLGADVSNMQGVYAVGNYYTDAANLQLPRGLDLLLGRGVYLSAADVGFTTDIGFIIDIWRFGVPLTILLYIGIFRLLKKIKNVEDALGGFIYGLMILVLLISNIKGNIISATPISALFLFLCYGFNNKKSINIKKLT